MSEDGWLVIVFTTIVLGGVGAVVLANSRPSAFDTCKADGGTVVHECADTCTPAAEVTP